MSLFFKNKPAVSPALRARVDALAARGDVTSAEDAVAVANEAAALTADLLKSIDAGAQPLLKGAPKSKPVSAPQPDEDEDEDDNYDPDAEGFDPASVDTGGMDDDDPDAEDDEPMLPTRRAPVQAPAKGRLAKSIEAIAHNDPHAARALAPVFDSIETTEAEASVTNDYLEQLGSLLTKSIEGLSIVAHNQAALDEKLEDLAAKIDERAAESQGLERANYETLSKSMESVMGYINGQRRAPLATPVGRAAADAATIATPALTGAVPVVQAATETHLGFTRPELKKSIEGALRSGNYLEKGLVVNHYNAIADGTPLDELPALVYDVAAEETGRLLAAPAASASRTAEFEPGLG